MIDIFVWKPLSGQHKALMRRNCGLMQREGLGGWWRDIFVLDKWVWCLGMLSPDRSFWGWDSVLALLLVTMWDHLGFFFFLFFKQTDWENCTSNCVHQLKFQIREFKKNRRSYMEKNSERGGWNPNARRYTSLRFQTSAVKFWSDNVDKFKLWSHADEPQIEKNSRYKYLRWDFGPWTL